MASKRKSTIPCMIPSKTMHLREELEQEAPSLARLAREQGFLSRGAGGGRGSPLVDQGLSSRPEGGDALKDGGGTYTCRPCNFETHDLNLFLDHVYSGHPDFRADPSFNCLDCGVSAAKFEGLALHNARSHPSTLSTMLQLRRRERRVVVEQSLLAGTEGEISITKTPIMRMLRGKSEPKRIVVSHSSSSDEISQEPLHVSAGRDGDRKEAPAVAVTHVPTIVHNGAATKVSLPSAIQIVNGSGTLPMLKTAITQVVSVVQNRSLHQQSAPITVSSAFSSTSTSASSKNMPKVMIPLSSIPTYSASMDSSSFLKTSFSKFPYPTKAELCYLTVVTKFPEEQIKIWFTAQRLKQGISWSPEEIEEARRKMFNTIIQTAPPSSQQQQRHNLSQSHSSQSQHTITVLPASLGPTGIPHILQGSLVSQGGVIVTQPMMANGIQVSSAPMALAVTPKPQAAARPMMQARPAAALVADKGISMVVGSVGSSSSGSHIVSSSGSSNGGSSTSSIISSSSSIHSNSSSSSMSSHASVINLSIGNSNYNNTNGKINNAKIININAYLNGKSNMGAASNVFSAKSNADAKNSEGRRSINNSSGVKSNSDSRVSIGISSPDRKANITSKDNNNQKSKDANSASNKSISLSSTTTTTSATTTMATPTAVTTNSTANTAMVKTEGSSSPATKSSSPAPATTPNSSGTPSSRTLPNTFLDPSFYKSKKSQEQLSALKESFLTNQFPNQEEVDRLIALTGLTVREVRKWFSDRRYHFRNLKGSRSSTGGQGSGKSATGSTPGSTPGYGTTPMDLSDGATRTDTPKPPLQGSAPLSPPPSQTPTSPTTPSRRPPRPPSPDFTAIRYKERDPQQVKALEASFSQDSDPPGEEVDRLRAETKMTRREIHGWFAERRKRVAAEKKKEELERAEREEEDMAEEAAAGGEEGKRGDSVKKEEDTEEGRDERQKEDGTGSELKVNPIKINLKMLKVTEANGKAENEAGQTTGQSDSSAMPPPSASNPTPSPSPVPSSTLTPKPVPSQSPKPSSSPKPSPIRGKKNAEQLHLLKQVYARTQWPSSTQYDELISGTGLPRPEVVRWFGDCRYVQKNGQLKWLEAYQTMALEEDLQRGDIQMLRAHLEAHGSLEEGQVLELAQASGLTEELVRRWFSTQTSTPPAPSSCQPATALPPPQTATIPSQTPPPPLSSQPALSPPPPPPLAAQTPPPPQAEGGGGEGTEAQTPEAAAGPPSVVMGGSASLPEPEQGGGKELRVEPSVCGSTDQDEEEKPVKAVQPAEGAE
ncbi:LOW QUALITY PROTEIN: zinc fingers and homeoboxes protein 3 [Osmerus mordax]|uniref:LOW QUALITY PROTEIN: zinc fingers and homeoboxes protein 3 n=1 Tax=Osmerus mordax TaxID=8014 RepID=UPI00350FFDE6